MGNVRSMHVLLQYVTNNIVVLRFSFFFFALVPITRTDGKPSKTIFVALNRTCYYKHMICMKSAENSTQR